MTYSPLTGVISKDNSTTAPLGAGDTFEGEAVDVLLYATLTVCVFSDVSSAERGLRLEISIDGTNWDRKKEVPFVGGGGAQVHSLTVVSQYFRFVYVNGPVPQTNFRVQTILHPTKPRDLTSSVLQTISGVDDVQLVRVAGDPLLDRNTGRMSTHRTRNFFGHNGDVGIVREDIWEVGGLYNFLEVGDTLRVAAGGDAADNAAGVGATSVFIAGLETGTWNEISEVVSTNGISASVSTAKSYIRVNTFVVASTGTYGGNNEGTINLETTGGILVSRIAAKGGLALNGVASIPAQYTAYLTAVRIAVGGSNMTASFFVKVRQQADVVSGLMGPCTVVARIDGLAGGSDSRVLLQSWAPITEKSDLWASGVGNVTGVSLASSFEYILVANSETAPILSI